MHMPSSPERPVISKTRDVIIIGAGFSGLCLAARLVEQGNRDFIIIEKGSSVGGTWRDNRYPGCACDIPSHLYSLSFGPRPDWSRYYPTQPELHDYLMQFAEHYNLLPHIRFNTKFESASWDKDALQWVIEIDSGNVLRSSVLVSAVGALHVPEKPQIDGIENFTGEVFHSAEWPQDFNASGKRIAVVGTGASAIQFVPQIARTAQSVTLFQRTAPWVLPKFDHPIGGLQSKLIKWVPGYRKVLRTLLYWLHEARLLFFLGGPRVRNAARRHATRTIEKAISDPELRAKITPDYDLGCKRTLISNDYYPALARDNVDVVTQRLETISGNTLASDGGAQFEADAIIFGTGFKVVESLMDLAIFGTNGIRLSAAWEDGPAAYMGISVPEFPNFFLMLGPNTGLGHNSQVTMIEAQAEHIVRALAWLKRNKGNALSVRPDLADAFDQETQKRLKRSVWIEGGCQSWYQDDTGRVVALWPRSTFSYILKARRRKDEEYLLVN